MFEVGTIIGGKYRIDRVIGRGGMGVVAVAMHLQLEQQFAIKVLHEIYAHDATSRDRFLREARTPMKLKSDHVCRVHDVGALDTGEPYIVMELLAGTDLATLARNPLPLPIAVDYILQAMIAIAEAHALGIVHRDLKPANLFVTRRIDGTALVKVLDFGIATAPAATDNRLTRTTTVMGSPGYMSPEQLRSARAVDARTDIWALGAILYEIVTGRVPFPATSVTELAMKVAVDPPAPIDVDPAYRAIVWRCLEKDPAKRYPDVGALAHDLAPLGPPGAAATAALIARLVGAGGATMVPGPQPIVANNAPTVASTTLGAVAGSHTHVAARKRPWFVIAIGVVALAVATIAGIAATKHDHASTPSDAAALAVVAIDAAHEGADAATRDVDFAGLAGEVEGSIAAGFCDRAAKLVASYHGPHDKTKLAADVAVCSARTAAAHAGRAAAQIGHPPALAPPDAAPVVVAPADAASADIAPIVDTTPAVDAGVVDPLPPHQFDALIMNGHCSDAAKIIGRVGATAERQAALSDCKTRLANATHHPEDPDAEKYILGLVAESPPAQREKKLNNFFYRAVLTDCDRHDIVNARKALSHLTFERQAAIETCLSSNGMTIP